MESRLADIKESTETSRLPFVEMNNNLEVGRTEKEGGAKRVGQMVGGFIVHF